MLMLLGTASAVQAQQGRGTIVGTVTDVSGAAVPGANITITNVETNQAFATTSSEDGNFTTPPLPIGNYTVTSELQGFKRALRSGITLQVDQKAQIDVQLETGEVSEQVEIISQVPLTDTNSATVGKVIENRRVVELPLNGRNALALAVLTPSVKSNAGSLNSGFADRGTSLSSISINGGPNAQNGNVLDGGNNIQTYIGEVSINPAVDAVEEFKVQSGTQSAEFGFTAGGIINLVTKAGTNNFHGTLYEFVRNDAFDARNAFATTKQALRYNQYGGSVGGPIYLPRFGEGGPAVYNGESRSFFFFNYEEFKFRRSVPVIGTVPTLLQRQGNFSDLRTANGQLIPVFDPATTRANPNGTGIIRTQFPGNIIPRERFDPVALAIQEYYPQPNRTPDNLITNINNYSTLSNQVRSMRQYTARIDHRFTENNNLTGRFSSYLHKSDNGGGFYTNPLIGTRDDALQTRNLILTDVHTFAPTLFNELRIGVNRGTFPFVTPSAGGGFPQLLGLPSNVPPDTFPQISGNGLPLLGTPGFVIGFRASTSLQLFDIITTIQGNHSIKFGLDVRQQRGANFQTSNPSGQFNFRG